MLNIAIILAEVTVWSSIELHDIAIQILLFLNFCLKVCIHFTCTGIVWWIINTLRPRQNGCHFADDTFSRIFLNENVRILFKFSLKFVPKGPIDNIPALVQIMAWRRPGDKPLSEPTMVCLLTHIWVTRPQWVKEPCKRDIRDYVIIKLAIDIWPLLEGKSIEQSWCNDIYSIVI